MKRYAKLIQADKRGQIVIPKDVRDALKITEETGFWVYLVEGEGILLKQVDAPELEEDPLIEQLKENAEKLGISEEKVQQLIDEHKKESGRLQDL